MFIILVMLDLVCGIGLKFRGIDKLQNKLKIKVIVYFFLQMKELSRIQLILWDMSNMLRQD